MAANTRTFSPPCSLNQVITATNFNKLDTNGTACIRRDSSKSGTKSHPFLPVETIDPAGGGLGTRMCYAYYGTLTCYNVAYDVYCPLVELPDAQVLNAVTVHCHPAGGHGAQPAVMFSIHVYKCALSDGTATLLGSGTHTWVDIATYQAGFDLTATGLAHTIDLETYTYVVKIILESGANSLTAGQLISMKVTCTLDLAEGGIDLSTWLHA